MNRDALLLLSVMLVAPILSGCGLIYDYDNCPAGYGEFDVEDDWRLAPSATPEGMAYIFFPSGDNCCWRFDFPGKEGGDVDLPDGDYNVLTFNDDTSGILFDNSESYRDFTFYCRTGALYDGLGGTIDNPLGPPVAANGEKVNICPDMLWCDAVNTFELYPDGGAHAKFRFLILRQATSHNVSKGNSSILPLLCKQCGKSRKRRPCMRVDQRYGGVTPPFRHVEGHRARNTAAKSITRNRLHNLRPLFHIRAAV